MAMRSTPGALKPVVSTPIEASALISPRLKAAMMRSRSGFGVSPKMVAAAEAARADRLGDVGGMLDAGAEGEPAAPVGAEPHHLVDRRLGDLGQVDRRLQLAGDELAAAAADARRRRASVSAALLTSGQR